MQSTPTRPRLCVVLKGYPRVSETFIAQELLGLQQAGIDFEIVSVRHPYDAFQHPIHAQITAPVRYLPERLREEPMRVLRAMLSAMTRPRFWPVLGGFARDFARDRTALRLRSFVQGLVMAVETPKGPTWVYSHFAHTPTSVGRYAARVMGAPFSISAHAKDIWTSPDWDLREKLTQARWTVTCTHSGKARLEEVAPGGIVHLLYHGLDLDRFPPSTAARSNRDGRDARDPVRVLSVGRAVPKKGYDVLLTALAALPGDSHWRFDHIGGGADLVELKLQADRLGIGDRVRWHGAQDQAAVLEAYRQSDIFVLASRRSADNDRDGLPNVLVEAASQRIACVATRFSAIPELFQDGISGLLVPPDDERSLTDALARAIADPDLRHRMGDAAETRVRRDFDMRPGIQTLKSLFETAWAADQRP